MHAIDFTLPHSRKDAVVLCRRMDQPGVFDVAVTRRVHKGCMVNLDNRTYSVRFVLVHRSVEDYSQNPTLQEIDRSHNLLANQV